MTQESSILKFQGHDSLDSTSINDEQIDLPFDKNATIGILKNLWKMESLRNLKMKLIKS